MNMLIAVLWIVVALSGCRQTRAPELRIEDKARDSARTAAP